MHRRSRASLGPAAAAIAACFAIGAPPARAQLILDSIPEVENVGIVERRGNQVPLDLAFTDARGKPVRFGDYFDGTRPVILVMAYYDCPMLCTLTLNAVQKSLNQLSWTAGEQFRIVTVSFDHRSTQQGAREKQAAYLAGYDRDVKEDAWPFLTGDPQNIRALAGAVGFHYKFFPETGQFSHPAAMIILSPDGKVSNYIEKLEYPAAEVKLALTEAAEGRIGSIFDRIQHYCFVYDRTSGKNTLAATRVMQVGGVGTLALLGAFVGVVSLARARRRASASLNDPGT